MRNTERSTGGAGKRQAKALTSCSSPHFSPVFFHFAEVPVDGLCYCNVGCRWLARFGSFPVFLEGTGPGQSSSSISISILAALGPSQKRKVRKGLRTEAAQDRQACFSAGHTCASQESRSASDAARATKKKKTGQIPPSDGSRERSSQCLCPRQGEGEEILDGGRGCVGKAQNPSHMASEPTLFFVLPLGPLRWLTAPKAVGPMGEAGPGCTSASQVCARVRRVCHTGLLAESTWQGEEDRGRVRRPRGQRGPLDGGH